MLETSTQQFCGKDDKTSRRLIDILEPSRARRSIAKKILSIKGQNQMRTFKVIVNGNEYEVGVEELSGGSVAAPAVVVAPTSQAPARQAAPAASKPVPPPPSAGGSETISAQMPGTIVEILVKEGEGVTRGQHLLVLEAMKMANQVVAPRDGTIAEIAVGPGALVNAGDVLVVLS
jgi:biotin carboxyl carrier protein